MYYLSFSDAAKFADVARNIVQSNGFGSNFTFFGGKVFTDLSLRLFPANGILYIMPFSISVLFKIFGISDFSVIATSLFYFLLTLVFVFLLSKKIYKSNLVGGLSTVAVGFSYDLINYATSGASESPFIFEIVASLYFASLKKKWATTISVLLMILMYYTRAQGFIYIAGAILLWLLIKFETRRALIYFSLSVLLGAILDRLIFMVFPAQSFFYSITAGSKNLLIRYLLSTSVSNVMRGEIIVPTFFNFIKKFFYDIYNFYKLLPQIINPYLFALFIIGLFRWGKDRLQNSFKITSLFIVITTLMVTAVSIPFFRYIHPIVPLVYIIAVGTLVELISNFQFPISKQILNSKFKITKNTFIILSSTFLILIFGVGQTLGVIFLDSRFEANTHNVGKPPVYVQLSYILRDNTNPGQIIITNLDTWGTWYGERKTVWFPLQPKQLIDSSTGKIPFDAIYLTSYLIDDENYYMGAEWREIFNNPTDSRKWTCDGCGEIAKEFKLKGVYKVSSSEDYEKQDASAILLIRND